MKISQGSDSPVLLGITMWVTWTLRPTQNDTAPLAANAAPRISMVSPQRLKRIGSWIEPKSEHHDRARESHHLVRFNVYNFGNESVTLHAIALKTLDGETLTCELVPALVVRSGARHPLLAEVTSGPVAEAVEIEAEPVVGRRLWVDVRVLPRP
jgi:hypothetical protein